MNPVRNKHAVESPDEQNGTKQGPPLVDRIVEFMSRRMKFVKILFWAVVIIIVVMTVIAAFLQSGTAGAATNIGSSTTSSIAFDPFDGFWNFYGAQTVNVAGTKVNGYATSSVGDMSLDCATTELGNICTVQSNYGICNGKSATHNTDGTCSGGDASGNLSGWAWNDNIGWISFCGGNNTPLCPNNAGGVSYGVFIDSNGNFNGWAWNDNIGWISFNCANAGGGNCSSNPYRVSTAWRSTSTVGYLESYVIDAGGPATLNSITWQGSCGIAGTNLGFEVAASNSTSGPWNFIGPSGTGAGWYGASCGASLRGGSSASCPAPGTPICVDPTQFNNFRYFKYRIMLQTNQLQNSTPRVDKAILNFSR